MKGKEIAKLSRNLGIKDFFNTTKNKAKFADDKVMTGLATVILTDIDKAADSAALTTLDNTGFSEEKLTKKNIMAQTAATLSANAQLKLEQIGKNAEAEQLQEFASYYSGSADALALARAEQAYDTLNNHIADLDPDYVSKAELAQFKLEITDYADCKGSSMQVNTTSPAITAAFKADLAKTDKDVENIKKRALKYTKDEVFYKSLSDVLKTPPVPVRHTEIDVIATNEATSDPLAGVKVTVSLTPKVVFTNEKGVGHYDSCKPGEAVITAELEGFQTFKGTYIIRRSELNVIRIKLSPTK